MPKWAAEASLASHRVELSQSRKSLRWVVCGQRSVRDVLRHGNLIAECAMNSFGQELAVNGWQRSKKWQKGLKRPNLVANQQLARCAAVYPKSARTKSAHRSPIIIDGALVLPEISRGMMLASATYSPSSPRYLR